MGYLRQNQIEEIENEKRVLERTLSSREVQERGNLVQHLKRIDHQIETQAPPDVTGEERDRLVRECKEIEGRLVPMMPSHEEMRKNPPGVVGRHMKYEKAAKSKDYFPEGDIFRWKDNQLTLNKGSDDPDVANFERMRPVHNMGSMLGAQIPGQQFFGLNPTEAYKEGYDRTFPGVAEEEEEDAPRPVTTRKKSARKKRPKKRPGKTYQTACGRAMSVQGKHFHVKHCETCQEAAEE
jgi:hypothetical protein